LTAPSKLTIILYRGTLGGESHEDSVYLEGVPERRNSEGGETRGLKSGRQTNEIKRAKGWFRIRLGAWISQGRSLLRGRGRGEVVAKRGNGQVDLKKRKEKG